MNGWRFDPISGLIGATFAFIVAWVLYLLRDSLGRMATRIKEAASGAFSQMSADSEHRYRDRVQEWAATHHALAHLAPLEQVFVPAPLVPPPFLPDPDETNLPQPEYIPLGTALNGHPRIALLGDTGSGRTTILTYLASVFARGEASQTIRAYMERLPVYVFLPDLGWDDADEPSQEDEGPQVESLFAKLITGVANARERPYVETIKKHLFAGTTIVLVDGWDELEAQYQKRAAVWLDELAASLPNNLWVVAARKRCFVHLTEAGFAPVRIGDWQKKQILELIDLWKEQIKQDTELSQADRASLVRGMSDALRVGATPMELSLVCWLFFGFGTLPRGRVDIFAQTLDLILSPPEESTWELQDVLAAVRDLALTLQEESRTEFSRQELENVLDSLMPPPEARPPRAKEHAIAALTAPGGLIKSFGDRLGFRHPLWQCYLAAVELAGQQPDRLLEHLDEYTWETVFDLYAELGPMEPIVKAWLSQPEDLCYRRLRRTARWVALTPPGPSWRNGVMALLARTFLSQDLNQGLRQRMAHALIQTNDPGVSYLFKQGAQHPRPEVRITVLEALGRLAREADVPILKASLADPDPQVRATAATALGKMGNQASLRLLAKLLGEAEQEIRMDIAHALAEFGPDGWEILKESLKHDDLLARRAAVFGLAIVDQPWVRSQLVEIAEQDPEWIVRSAAEAAISSIEEGQVEDKPPVTALPPLAEMGWLIRWAAQQGQAVGQGDAVYPVVVKATQDGSPEIKLAAVWALGIGGTPEQIPALRQATRDVNPQVAQAAMEALQEVCDRYGTISQ